MILTWRNETWKRSSPTLNQSHLLYQGTGVPVANKKVKKALFPVCFCGEDRAACGACGKGYAQETAAGRAPKMIEKEVSTQDQINERFYFDFLKPQNWIHDHMAQKWQISLRLRNAFVNNPKYNQWTVDGLCKSS